MTENSYSTIRQPLIFRVTPPKISTFSRKILSFLQFSGSFEACVTVWGFDRVPSDA
jgi:hypothetical protein